MIYVNSTIMGGGKSMAAITYMNEHPNERYIYIAPYLSEDDRIYKACERLRFVRPNGKYPGKTSIGKLAHVAEAIEQGRNIATTHQLFKMMTPQILDVAKEQQYTLIVDETLDVLEKTEFNDNDLKLLLDAGCLVNENGKLVEGDSPYKGEALKKDIFLPMRSRDIVLAGDDADDRYRWFLPIRMMSSFKDVYILTYLFDGQLMKYYLDVAGLPYQRIGVSRDSAGTFRFASDDFYIPDYVHHIHDMIRIVSDKRMNEIGENRTDLSMAWFNTRGDKDELRKCLRRYFREMHPDTPTAEKLWGGFKKYKTSIQDRGYASRFLSFNARAMNDYGGCTCVAYPVNVFMPPSDKNFFKIRDLDFDEDIYALSTMVQFLWRSAIRNGKPIDLYLPSSRMRNLLLDWMDSVCEGGAVTV